MKLQRTIFESSVIGGYLAQSFILPKSGLQAVTSVLSDLDIVKSPNCDILADFYVKVLTTCCDVKNAHNILLKNYPDERLAQLLSWINQFYKFNIEQAMILQTLHNLLDYIIKTEVFDDKSIPSSYDSK
ncbi:hypothetical protein TNCV_990541 [Trichonephila clavipes]|nr:hypothetical protein TNCV_990541 [Trichonephila clavipes]